MSVLRTRTAGCPRLHSIPYTSRTSNLVFVLERRFEGTGSASASMCETAQSHFAARASLDTMSERNGDRARFQKDRKRKLHHRQRIHTLMASIRKKAGEAASTRTASLNMHDEGGPARIGD